MCWLMTGQRHNPEAVEGYRASFRDDPQSLISPYSILTYLKCKKPYKNTGLLYISSMKTSVRNLHHLISLYNKSFCLGE